MADSFTVSLRHAWARSDSLLCVGLDPDPARFPRHLAGAPDAILRFCTAIVDATADLACAFKPQIAYFAAHRAEDQLEALIAHIHARHPGVPVVLDAKRGDIGSTAEQYAREVFEVGGERLYERVARLAAGPWNRGGELGLVVGATVPAELARVREIAPTLPLLVPGVGAQGGDVEATVRAGRTADGTGMMINSSRAILYAGAGEDFAEAARRVAIETRDAINRFRGA
jgi:orotidine-5'-phosphate decarboxylase